MLTSCQGYLPTKCAPLSVSNKYAYILLSLICPKKCAALSVSQVVKKCADFSVRNMLTFGLFML